MSEHTRVVFPPAGVKSAEEAHAALKEALRFPEHYGMNLDALMDCLTERREEVVFEIRIDELTDENLKRTLRAFVRVIKAAGRENPAVHVEVIRQK